MTQSRKLSLAITHPHIATQADGWDPTTVSAGSPKKFIWRCDAGHQFEASVEKRTNRKQGCPYCSGNKALIGFNDLATTHPEIAALADGWDPTQIKRFSGLTKNWICSNQHRWTRRVSDLVGNGEDCPYCSNKKVLTGFNDLATTHPEIAAEADGWDPTTITASTTKKLNWICKEQHCWTVDPNYRTKNRQRCPICTNRKVLTGFNDLATTHPEIAAEADGWDPTTVTSGSERNSNWKCEAGHKYETTIKNRSAAKGCPVCSNKKVLTGFNDLATTHPEIAAEADGWDPTTVVAGSNLNQNWICKLNHTWITDPNHRTRRGDGCPYCSGNKVLAGFNDLKTRHPELAIEADGWDPESVTAGSGIKVRWKCKLNHIWNATVANRTNLSNETGCPYCSGHKVWKGFNDLATTNPELAAEADGWDPTTVTAGSGIKVRWKCANAHSWEAVVSSRAIGNGCPICSNKKVLAGFNDLATTHPEIAAEADGWDPTTVTSGSDGKRDWICRLGHKYHSRIANRGSHGVGCPVCANLKLLVGYNDLQTVRPDLARQADGWDPSAVIAGAASKRSWYCSKQHKWIATVDARMSGKGCPICANQVILKGYNDLATTHPELIAEADGWDTTKVIAGSGIKRKWICEFGHRWMATTRDRAFGNKTGCPSCAKFGFDPNKDAWLYFIEHDQLQMLQIGITNFPDSRLKSHKRGGWEIIELRGPMDGHLTQIMETNCLHALEKRGAVLGHKAKIESFDGYSEAWTKASLTVTSIKQIFDWVYEDEGINNKP